MTYVVTESCINCRYGDCVAVCPVDCFHQGPNFLVINPDACIDCGVCVEACPVRAIFEASQVPADQQGYIAVNAELARRWPSISGKAEPLPDADHWASIQHKAELLMEQA